MCAFLLLGTSYFFDFSDSTLYMNGNSSLLIYLQLHVIHYSTLSDNLFFQSTRFNTKSLGIQNITISTLSGAETTYEVNLEKKFINQLFITKTEDNNDIEVVWVRTVRLTLLHCQCYTIFHLYVLLNVITASISFVCTVRCYYC